MVLWRGHLPLTRLREKTRPPQQSRARQPTLRATAVKEGLAPKARKAFALYVMEKSQVKAGAGRDAFALEMKRLGREWAALPSSLKAHYHERSAAEFQCQRDALLRKGIKVRAALNSRRPSPVQQVGQSQGKKIRVGPYTVEVEASEEDKDDGWTVLGSGSYGKVFLAATPQGQPCAVKVFSGSHATEGAEYEAGLLKSLASLSACDSQWFPILLAASPSAEPWPWMSLSFGGSSLAKVISENGPLAPKPLKAFVSQLECALRVLHKKAGLLHLDIKPSNILWCAELNCLKVCDLGMAERWQPATSSLQSEPRFEQYVTSWYRPPELWQLDGRIASLQKALSPSVDVWSFGCVVFEAACGAVLMRPMKVSSCPSKSVTSWCKNWPNLRLDAQGGVKANSSADHAFHHFMTRLQRLPNSVWRKVVLNACAPDPLARHWK